MIPSSVSNSKTHRKTIRAALINGVVIISFFVLFYSGIDVDSFPALAPILLIIYALGISICTGIVIASIAETKDMVSWKWGLLASAMTLILMIVIVIFPSMWSGLAFIIAPLMSTAFLLVFMNSGEPNSDNDQLSRP